MIDRALALRLSITLASAGMMACAAPASAQATSSQAAPIVQPEPDPARLAGAERVVDRIWPVGTLRRVMESTMGSTVDTMAGLGAMTGNGTKAERRAQHEARTGRTLPSSAQQSSAADATAAMNAVLLPVMERMEPPLRAAIVRIYARRYDATQLGELEAFFSTPTGTAYAADSLTLMSEPEMMTAMQESMTEMMAVVMSSALTQAGATLDADAADAAASAVKIE